MSVNTSPTMNLADTLTGIEDLTYGMRVLCKARLEEDNLTMETIGLLSLLNLGLTTCLDKLADAREEMGS